MWLVDEGVVHDTGPRKLRSFGFTCGLGFVERLLLPRQSGEEVVPFLLLTMKCCFSFPVATQSVEFQSL